MKKLMAGVAATAVLAAPTALVVGSADAAAAAAPRTFQNCTALNKVYKHGVARAGARDKVSGKAKPVKNFTVDTKTYNLNTKSDRDKDGIACEKK